jgi:flagellar FliL protein
MTDVENDDALQTPDAKTEAKPKKKGRSKLLVIGIPAFVLLMGGGAGAWWYFNQPIDEAAHVEEEDGAPSGMVSLESFIANLADPGGRKYLRVSIVVLVADEETASAFEADKLTMSRVRAAVLEVLTTRTSTEIVTPEGRAAVKKSIAETINHIGHLDVRDVLFEEFLVQ